MLQQTWEQRKLGEIVSAYSGGTPSASNKEYYGGDIPFIRSAEINNNHTELYITQKGLKDSSAKLVEKGTILYAMYGATSGEVSISQIDGAINQAILAMVPLRYDGEFIAQYLRRQKKNIINKYLQGGQGNLSANIVLNLQIQLPGVDEANQITSFFVKLDNLITLHQRKLEHLKLKKKSLLQKLFPKEGEVYPELRFPGFTEPWEQRKLGELADGVFGGGTPKTSIDTYWNGSIPWIQSSNLMDDKIENFINDKSITNLAIKESATKLIPANSIAIVTRVGVGKVALIREKFATSQDFLSFHCRHEHNPLFMSYQISRLMKVKSRLLQGTSIKGITKSEVLESEVLIPKGIEEENKIADFLSSCDNLITLHQEESFLHKYML